MESNYDNDKTFTRRKRGDKCDWLQRQQEKARFEQLKVDIAEQVAGIPVATCMPIPITHNPEVIYLQYYGWSINLYPNGTWFVEDTEGG